jgi:citrate lyase subunit beta/citryl-CoA lyase
MMAKAAASGADLVFFDLEDACAPSEKESARTLVVEALSAHDFGRTSRAVRVNSVDTAWCYRDIVEVVTGAGHLLDSLILPKVEDRSQVHFVDHLLAGIERELGRAPLALEVQIESARGATELREICRASERIEAVIFGPGDYAASVGAPGLEIGADDDRYQGHQWGWVMSELAAHARAAGAAPIDGPSADYKDESSFHRSALQARLLGYDGKWCIHPNQIPWANEVFSPTPAEAEAAQAVLDAYATAIADGRGAIALDGKLVDEASRKLAESVVARARAAQISS